MGTARRLGAGGPALLRHHERSLRGHIRSVNGLITEQTPAPGPAAPSESTAGGTEPPPHPAAS